MRQLTVSLGARSYPILIGTGLLRDPESYGLERGRPQRLVTDRNVAAHHLRTVQTALRLRDEQVLVLEPGENSKSVATVEQILDWLLAEPLPRDGCLLALGGGVIGDLGGFVAAIYQRGIDFVQIPTTLLALVDSSVGGKTGVNHARGKNMIGAFHQPRRVLADLDTLATLPRRELLAGVAEIIKYGMLGDAQLFAWIEKHLDRILALESSALAKVVEDCCTMKARIVAEDERENPGAGGARALLNLGHTFGHAIETHAGYGAWLHGEAVAAGLCMAADLSARLGWIAPAVAQRCARLVETAGLPTRPPAGLDAARFLELMRHDKKVHAGRLRLVLLRGLGQAVVTADFDEQVLQDALKAYCRPAS